MTESDRPQSEIETVTIPTVDGGEASEPTLELPVVESPVVEPPVVEVKAAPPEPAPPVVEVKAASPVEVTAPAPVPPLVSPPPAASGPPGAPRGGTGGRRRAMIGLVVAALVATIGYAVWHLSTSSSTTRPAASSSARAAVLKPASVTSFDPSGGTGFRRAGTSTWRTQTYRSARFGNLKPGVGLLLDLGAERRLASVTLNAVTPGLTVELRAGDQRSGAATDFRLVGHAQQASEATTLPAGSGGTHRYWLVWVTQLGSGDGGYAAVIRGPVAHGNAG